MECYIEELKIIVIVVHRRTNCHKIKCTVIVVIITFDYSTVRYLQSFLAKYTKPNGKNLKIMSHILVTFSVGYIEP